MELCVFALGVSTGMHGRDNENTLHKKEIFFVFPLWKKNLLFLPCNMAVVQNLYSVQESTESPTNLWYT